jgi:hypothetical protein
MADVAKTKKATKELFACEQRNSMQKKLNSFCGSDTSAAARVRIPI